MPNRKKGNKSKNNRCSYLFTENANIQPNDNTNTEIPTADSDGDNDEDDNDSDESDDGKLFNTFSTIHAVLHVTSRKIN